MFRPRYALIPGARHIPAFGPYRPLRVGSGVGRGIQALGIHGMVIAGAAVGIGIRGIIVTAIGADMNPSTPDPATVTLVAALLRHLLTIASGVGLTVGVYSDSTLTLTAGGIVGAATVGWSLWQKFQAARISHSAATQSAILGKAVKPA